MEFTNLTRHLGIGANSYLLRIGGKNIILDAGADPKIDGLGTTPDFSTVPVGEVDAIIITHAHQDHIGSLPALTRREQRCPVFMTEETKHISEIMLHNSVNVMTRQREELGLMEYPLFTHRGVDLSRQSWVGCALRRRLNLLGEPSEDDNEVTFEFYHAGHILGSAGVLIRHGGRSVFYTGDVNFEDQAIMTGADFPREGVDVLIMETTRGDSSTPLAFTREGEEERFCRAVRGVMEAGGSLTIPVFALGKTQEVLAILWKMRLRGEIGHVPIYIGGLSVKITTVYDKLAGYSRRSHPELQLLQEMAPYILSGREIVDGGAQEAEHLCDLERDDDRAYAIQYFRPAGAGRSGAEHVFCGLLGSRLAIRAGAPRRAGGRGHARQDASTDSVALPGGGVSIQRARHAGDAEELCQAPEPPTDSSRARGQAGARVVPVVDLQRPARFRGASPGAR